MRIAELHWPYARLGITRPPSNCFLEVTGRAGASDYREPRSMGGDQHGVQRFAHFRSSSVRIRLVHLVTFACTCWILAWNGSASALTRYPVDQQEIARLTAEQPHVAGLLQQGETLAVAGDLDQALRVFGRAAEEYPYSALLQRRRCEALTVLGPHADAVKACLDAMQYGSSPLTVRATVRAFLSDEDALSAGDLAGALMVAVAERRRMPQEPWGYEALCEVAEHVGDEVMLQYCSAELQRLAPEDPTTRRVLAELSPRWWVGGAWLVIALALMVTALHALWRALRRPGRRTQAAAVAGLLCLAVTDSTPARAEGAPQPSASVQTPRRKGDDLTVWTIDDELPESNIPGEGARNRNPLQFGYWLQDLTARAGKASEGGYHQTAVKYYRALAKAVPDQAIAFSKLCAEYDALGNRDDAILSCAAALIRPGVVLNDYFRYVHVVISKPGRLSDKDLSPLLDVISHVRADPGGGNQAADELECDVGVKTKDISRLEKCTASLANVAAKDPKTLTYQWSLAMLRNHYDEAESLLARVKESSMKPEGLAQMDRETRRGRFAHRMRTWLVAIGVGTLLGAFGWALLSRRRRSVSQVPTPQAS